MDSPILVTGVAGRVGQDNLASLDPSRTSPVDRGV